jgi:hypothetical protein
MEEHIASPSRLGVETEIAQSSHMVEDTGLVHEELTQQHDIIAPSLVVPSSMGHAQ